MEYTEQQKVEFKEQFRERKKRQIVVAVLVGISLVPVLIIRAFPNSVNSDHVFFIGIAFLPAVVFRHNFFPQELAMPRMWQIPWSRH